MTYAPSFHKSNMKHFMYTQIKQINKILCSSAQLFTFYCHAFSAFIDTSVNNIQYLDCVQCAEAGHTSCGGW